MAAAPAEQTGLALGVWGAVQATAAGTAIAFGGGLRDGLSALAESGAFGDGLMHPATGYVGVYLIEIILLFVTLAVVGPLVRATRRQVEQPRTASGIAGPQTV